MLKKAMAIILGISLMTAVSAAFAAENALAPQTLRISEIMASNHITLEDVFGRYPDWVEIHNTTDQEISLEGVCLSDKKEEPYRYAFPAGSVIGPDEYIIIYASGAKKDIADEYHTPFKLSAGGEALYLSRDGILLDSMLYGPQDSDISLSLDENGAYVQTLTATPGAANIITPLP